MLLYMQLSRSGPFHYAVVNVLLWDAQGIFCSALLLTATVFMT